MSYYLKNLQQLTMLIGTDFHSLPHYTFYYTQVESGLALGTNKASMCPEVAHFQGVTFYIFFFNKNSSKYNNFFLSGVAENTEQVPGRTILYHVKEKHNSSNCYITVGTLTRVLTQVIKIRYKRFNSSGM
jgi:hypothetical protein